ncbi:MAG: ATP-binding protein [Spirochaetes bacterium]|nr:ATP-binding protein [Spirochaetota bacterium]
MNPFKYGTIVRGEYFYDRSEECKRIVSTLSGGNNIVLLAPRRYGKTSLVFRALEELESKGFTCVYFDFMPVYSRESFIEAYTRSILAKQGNWEKAVKKVGALLSGVRLGLSLDPAGTPEFRINFIDAKVNEKTLQEILELPERLASGKKKFIMVFDEFQEIVKLNGENFEGLLRSTIQRQRNVNYLFLGSRTHLLSDMFHNKNRAFYDSAMSMQLDLLPERESVAYLKKRFAESAIKIDNATAGILLNQAGNIPYYIQLLAAEVWQYSIPAPAVVSEKSIIECAGRILDLKSDYYSELFDRHSAAQKKLLKALVSGSEGIYSAGYSSKHRLSAVSTTQKALAGLIESGIVEKTGNQFIIGDPFFRLFIKNYAY